MSEITDRFDKALAATMNYAIPNAAIRTYMYNLAGKDKLTNNNFREDELIDAEIAWRNAKSGRQDKPVAVMPQHYLGDAVETGGNNGVDKLMNPIKALNNSPMRMTLGRMWVAPNGQVLHTLNDNFYTGDVYDFDKRVQTSSEYHPIYKFAQNLATKAREVQGKPPMLIDINLKDK